MVKPVGSSETMCDHFTCFNMLLIILTKIKYDIVHNIIYVCALLAISKIYPAPQRSAFSSGATNFMWGGAQAPH
jgi:hypothetical protein